MNYSTKIKTKAWVILAISWPSGWLAGGRRTVWRERGQWPEKVSDSGHYQGSQMAANNGISHTLPIVFDKKRPFWLKLGI